MVEDGHIAFPRQVVKELREDPHPDVPGAWIQGVAGASLYPLDADVDQVAEIMARTAGLVDPNAEGDPADPWIVALALDIPKETENLDVTVVTNDHVRHHGNDSVTSACEKFDVSHTTVEGFLDEITY